MTEDLNPGNLLDRPKSVAQNLDAPIFKLPRELLINIFLDVEPDLMPFTGVLEVRQVCKAWNAIIEETPIFWQDIVFPERPMTYGSEVQQRTPNDLLAQAKVYLERSQGHIQSLVVPSFALRTDKDRQDMQEIASMIPWSTLQVLVLDSIMPACFIARIKDCSKLRCLDTLFANHPDSIKAGEPIASANLKQLSLRFENFAKRDDIVRLNPVLFARAKEISIDVAESDMLSPEHYSHLDNIIQETIDEGNFESIKVKYNCSNYETALFQLAHKIELSIELRRYHDSQSSSATIGSACSELSFRHYDVDYLLENLPKLRNAPVTHVQLHSLDHFSMTRLTALQSNWPNLEHLTIEKCGCDRGRSFLNPSEGLKQAKDVLDILASSPPRLLRRVKLQGFEELECEGKLKYVKRKVDMRLSDNARRRSASP